MPLGNFKITDFLANFKGGAREYLFYVSVNPPSLGFQRLGASNQIYLVNSSTIPAATYTESNVNYQGWTAKYAGNKTFADWSCMFNIDEGSAILNDYHIWHNSIRSTNDGSYLHPDIYFGSVDIELLAPDGISTISAYKLNGAWPKDISTVTLNYGSNNIATFTVTFSYQYYDPFESFGLLQNITRTVTNNAKNAVAAAVQRGLQSALG